MKKLLSIIFFLYLFGNSFAEEIFVGYLKPYLKKTEKSTMFKRKDPTEEPYKPQPKLTGKVTQPKEEQIEGIDLKAILYHPIHKKAFINESLLSVGDKIGDNIIVRDIKENAVVIEKNKRLYTLKIEEGDKQ